MKNMLPQRSSMYEMQVNGMCAAEIFTTGTKDSLRELIRSVVREELQKVGVASQRGAAPDTTGQLTS